jgi:prepilin-type N-terminal cleavage/methylation domain-containing protein/prepilin-type processing-associated H-X9-DG protein
MSSTQQHRPARRTGFTLIELLVVIAIIALLISILLPAISKMRISAWKIISLSNLRNVAVAFSSYSETYQGMPPLLPPRTGRGMLPEFIPGSNPRTRNSLNGYCTWTFAGKNTRGQTTTGQAIWSGYVGGIFDIEAADRPLNSFLTNEPFWAPDGTNTMAAGDDTRRKAQLLILKDPSDKIGHQWGGGGTPPMAGWPNQNALDPTTGQVSCYDDTGTSYQFTAKWHDQLVADPSGPAPGSQFGPGGMANWYLGLRRIRSGDAFNPSRFAWLHDEYADLVAYNTNPSYQKRNGYGDFNRSNMLFLDGHAGYIRIRPGNSLSPPNDNSFVNSDYEFIFPYLRR